MAVEPLLIPVRLETLNFPVGSFVLTFPSLAWAAMRLLMEALGPGGSAIMNTSEMGFA